MTLSIGNLWVAADLLHGWQYQFGVTLCRKRHGWRLGIQCGWYEAAVMVSLA